MAHAEVGERVDDRVLHRRCGADGAGLADALGPELVVRRRRLHRDALEHGQLGGGDHRVVHEVGGQGVAVLVVAHLLEQRLCRALGQAAVHLAVGEERVEDGAGVVDCDEAGELDRPGLRVDLDHGEVGAEGEGRPGGVEVGHADQRVGAGGGAGHLVPAHRDGGHAGHVEAAPAVVAGVAQHQVVGIGLEQVGGGLPGEVVELAGGVVDGRAGHLHRAGAAGHRPGGDDVGVAEHDLDLVDGHAEAVGHEHGPGRLVALAVGGRARLGEEGAVGAQLDGSELGAAPERGDLDVHREAEAQRLGGAGLPAALLLGPQFRIAGGLEQEVERGGVGPDVVGGAAGGVVGEGVVGEEVAAAHLGGVLADLCGEEVDRPLDGGGGLGATRPPERDERRGVGGHGLGAELRVGHVVDARGHHPGHERQDRPHHRVGPRVLHDLQAVGGDLAVAGAPDGDVLDLGPAVTEVHHRLGAGLGPLDGSAEVLGQRAEEEVLGVGARLRAEAAADVGGDDTDLVLVEPEHLGHRLTDRVGALVAGVDHEAAVLVPVGRRRAGLDGARRHLLVDDALLDHDLAVGEVGGHAAGGDRHDPLGVGVGEQEVGRGEGGLGVDHRVEGVVVDDDQLGGVGGLGAGLGHHRGDGLAHEAHDVTGQQGPQHLLVQEAHRRGLVGDVDVVDGPHREHARHRRRLADVDLEQAGAGHGGAHVDHVGRRPRQHDVVDVGAPDGQEGGVLGAQDPIAQDAHEGPPRGLGWTGATVVLRSRPPSAFWVRPPHRPRHRGVPRTVGVGVSRRPGARRWASPAPRTRPTRAPRPGSRRRRR